MAAPAFALLLVIQTSSMPSEISRSPGIWSPPKSSSVPAQSLPVANAAAADAGRLAVLVRRQIAAELRSGEISPAQARAFRRELDGIDGWSWSGLGAAQSVQAFDSLEALSSLIYTAGSVVTPK